MRPFHLPADKLVTAFLVIQAIVTGSIMLWGHYGDASTVFKVVTKIVGSNTVLFGLWEFFRKKAWKWRIFRLLGLVNFPDINGKWEGTLNWQGRPANIPATFLVTQSYTDISIEYHGAMSISHSIIAGLAITGDESVRPTFHLVMTFRNERTKVLSDEELKARNLKAHVSARGTVALAIEGKPARRMAGALWTEPQTADPAIPHETHGYYELFRTGSVD